SIESRCRVSFLAASTRQPTRGSHCGWPLEHSSEPQRRGTFICVVLQAVWVSMEIGRPHDQYSTRWGGPLPTAVQTSVVYGPKARWGSLCGACASSTW